MKTPGQIAYERYIWVSMNGHLGCWEDLDECYKNAWEEGAQSVIAAHLKSKKTLGQIGCEALNAYLHQHTNTEWIGHTANYREAWEAAAKAILEAAGSPAANPKPIHILAFDSCLVCPYHRQYTANRELHCFHKGMNGRVIGPANEHTPIPDFCPLPKKEDAK